MVGLTGWIVSLGWQAVLASRLEAPPEDPAEALARIFPVFIGVPILIVLFLVLHAGGCLAVTAAAEDLYLGRPTGAGAAVRKSWRRTLPASVTSLICTILSTVGFMLCCLPGFAVSAILVLSVPLVYLEKRSIMSAIERSSTMTMRSRGPGPPLESHWLRALGIGLVVFAVYYALTLFSQLPLLALSVLPLLGHRTYPTALGPQPLPLSMLLPLQIVCTLIQGLFFAIIFIPWTLLYYDIRIRREGLGSEPEITEDGNPPPFAGAPPGPGDVQSP